MSWVVIYRTSFAIKWRVALNESKCRMVFLSQVSTHEEEKINSRSIQI